MLKYAALTLTLVMTMTMPATAALKTERVTYTAADGATLEGYLAYDDTATGARPAVIIVHDWMGLGEFTETKANELTERGYIAFAADIYGKGVRPADTTEAGKLAGSYKDNRPLLQSRVRAAYDALVALPIVDSNKIVATGYCFGGTTALELARSGAKLAGVASFHGGLTNPTPENAKNITAPVLIMHGADDPLVPPAEVEAFKAEMKNAPASLEFIAYPDAVHSFTNPAAGNDKSKGFAYNAAADAASAIEFNGFLNEVTK
jgi:dienelactone hydrolase